MPLSTKGWVFVLLLVGTSVYAQKSQANLKVPAPQVPVLDRKPNQVGERAPGESKLELEIERTSLGRYRVKSIDPEGPFGAFLKDGTLKEGQEFDRLDQIPRPQNH